jgi:tetratricopeptide (TPR) repeat protein
MRTSNLVVLALLLTGTSLSRAEEPPYKRLLQGDDARKAAALQKQIEALWATAKFDEAVKPAEELRALRQRVQGEKHWEVADAARLVQTLRQAAALPVGKRTALAAAPALVGKASVLYGQGKYAEAEPLFRQALAVREEVLGPRHPDSARSCNNLATNLEAQGRAKEAEPLFQKALDVSEEVLGPRHPDTASSYNNLAYNLWAQGRYPEAEPLDRKALAVREEVLGPRHPDTARSCNNLATNLQAQGRYQEAEPLLRRALDVWKEVLGPRHPDTATSYNNLAANLEAQGQAREAEPLFRKALAVREGVLGPRHPHTARSYNNLAENLHAQGRYQEAEPLLRRALAVREEVLGPRHPDTATGYHNLAVNLETQGWAREAEPLSRQALAIAEEVLGPRHPRTAAGYNDLAANLQAQGRYREAEPLLRRALDVREEVLGPRHPDTAASSNNLAYNLRTQGRYREAEPLLRRALDVREEVLGPRHPDTAASYDNLAANLLAQGQAREAEPLFRKALAVRAEVLGPRHPDTARSSCTLATNLLAQGRVKETEPLYRQALAAYEEVLGPRHPSTALGYNNLAANLQAQGRYPEAEPLWQKAAQAKEAARLRLTAATLDRAVALPIDPHLGLAACRARLERPADAWSAAEAGLSRGILDDLDADRPAAPDADRKGHDRATRLDALDRVLTPLLSSDKLDPEARRRRDALLRERQGLDEADAQAAAERSRRSVRDLAAVQAVLADDEALLFWLDFSSFDEHWGCVVRHRGVPVWVRLPGSGRAGAWTPDDDHLPRRLRDGLTRGEADADRDARRLAEQRLAPLRAPLDASADLPAARRLLVVPVGAMAGVPVEALTERHLVSYVPSASVLVRLREKHRPLRAPTLLALGDPDFRTPNDGPPPPPPERGLYLSLVLPGGNAARAGLRSGDVLLRYGGAELTARDDLKPAPEGGALVPVVAWRNGQTLDDLRIAPGKLGVVISPDPLAVALRKHRETEQLADARLRDGVAGLPGTRLEVQAIAALLPEGQATLLLGSRASEQELDALAAAGKLKEFRLLHLATHGTVDPVSAARSALLLARDRLPGVAEQGRLRAAGKRVPTGRLSADTIARDWQLDADLVTLSACETGIGRDAGGEGLLGFAQVLLGCGARSLLLSLWKVDDTATALLMTRFYQNLLGKRPGLSGPLPKAEALREAKAWLRSLRRSEAEALAGRLAQGSVRASEEPKGSTAPAALPLPSGATPFAQPRYWAAFILIGDPE